MRDPTTRSTKEGGNSFQTKRPMDIQKTGHLEKDDKTSKRIQCQDCNKDNVAGTTFFVLVVGSNHTCSKNKRSKLKLRSQKVSLTFTHFCNSR